MKSSFKEFFFYHVSLYMVAFSIFIYNGNHVTYCIQFSKNGTPNKSTKAKIFFINRTIRHQVNYSYAGIFYSYNKKILFV